MKNRTIALMFSHMIPIDCISPTEGPLGENRMVDVSMRLSGPGSVKPLPDGGFVYGGWNNNIDAPEAILLWTDKEGNETFRLSLAECLRTDFANVCVLDDGSVIAQQNIYAPTSDHFPAQRNLVHAKDGRIIMSELLSLRPTPVPELLKVDGGYMLLHTERIEADGDTLIVNALEMRDLEGNTRWRRLFEDGDISMLSVLCLADGYILCGSIEKQEMIHSHPMGLAQGMMLKMDHNGCILWQVDFPAERWILLKDCMLGANGTIYAYGMHVMDPSSVEDDCLPRSVHLCLSPDGELLWRNEYAKGDRTFRIFDMLTTENGFIGLRTADMYRAPVHLVQLDMDGAITGEWPIEQHAEGSLSKLYLIQAGNTFYVMESVTDADGYDTVYMTPVDLSAMR